MHIRSWGNCTIPQPAEICSANILLAPGRYCSGTVARAALGEGAPPPPSLTRSICLSSSVELLRRPLTPLPNRGVGCADNSAPLQTLTAGIQPSPAQHTKWGPAASGVYAAHGLGPTLPLLLITSRWLFGPLPPDAPDLKPARLGCFTHLALHGSVAAQTRWRMLRHALRPHLKLAKPTSSASSCLKDFAPGQERVTLESMHMGLLCCHTGRRSEHSGCGIDAAGGGGEGSSTGPAAGAPGLAVAGQCRGAAGVPGPCPPGGPRPRRVLPQVPSSCHRPFAASPAFPCCLPVPAPQTGWDVSAAQVLDAQIFRTLNS